MIVVIGLLAALTIPKFTDLKARAYVPAQRSDLANLALLQEAHFSTSRAYAASAALVGITPSDGVTLTVTEVTGGGWSATTSHVATAAHCGLFYGNAAPVVPAVTAGVIECQ